MNPNDPTRLAPASPRNIPRITLLIAAITLAAYCWPALATALEYDRSAIADREMWRLATSHVTHWNLDHLAWDLGVFVLLGVICERRNRLAYAACLGLSALLIPIGVLLLIPQMTLYRGLSGIDTALFTLLGVTLLRDAVQSRQRLAAATISALFAAVVAKTGFDLWTGSTLFVDDAAAGFTPVPLAHILGVAVGLAVGALSYPSPMQQSAGEGLASLVFPSQP